MFLVLFFVFLASLFLVYALFLLTSRKSDARRKLLNDRLAEAIRSSAHSTDVEVQLAREELLSEIPWLNRSLLKISVTSKLKQQAWTYWEDYSLFKSYMNDLLKK